MLLYCHRRRQRSYKVLSERCSCAFDNESKTWASGSVLGHLFLRGLVVCWFFPALLLGNAPLPERRYSVDVRQSGGPEMLPVAFRGSMEALAARARRGSVDVRRGVSLGSGHSGKAPLPLSR